MARSNCVSDLSFSDLEGLRSQTKETDEIASIEKCGDGASPRVITLFLQFPSFDFSFVQGCAESGHHLPGASEADPGCDPVAPSPGYPNARPGRAGLTAEGDGESDCCCRHAGVCRRTM